MAVVEVVWEWVTLPGFGTDGDFAVREISSLVSFTRTPTTPAMLIRRLLSLPTSASTRSVCSVVHSSMMAARTRR